MKSISRLAVALGSAFALTACSNQADLDKAHSRIEELEAKLAQCSPQNKPAETNQSKTEPTSEVEKPAPEIAHVASKWEYEHEVDPMNSKVSNYASLESNNTVELSAPYDGEQHGRLLLRSRASDGKSVMLQISRGQILCLPFQGCNVTVRFDDAPPVKFSGTGPSDHSTTVVFLNNYNGFFERLKKAKRVRMSVDIYQAGAPVFEFDVSGFNPEEYIPKASKQ